MCDCINLINARPEMVESNAHLQRRLFGPPRVFVATVTDKKVRGKSAPAILASYCPFCGVKYGETI